MPCAVFSYGQCWLPGPAPLALYVNACVAALPNDPLRFIGMRLLRQSSSSSSQAKALVSGDTDGSTSRMMASEWKAARACC